MKEIKNKNKTMLYVELEFGDTLENVLHWLYIDEQLSIREVAEILDIHFNTIRKWLNLAGIKMRLPHDKMLELIAIKTKLKESI